jgi:hypothetical protein
MFLPLRHYQKEWRSRYIRAEENVRQRNELRLAEGMIREDIFSSPKGGTLASKRGGIGEWSLLG